MPDNLPNLKKHTCPTCGGQLTVNEKRQMYECPFCGVSFDYEYFREDDVLSRAARALASGEFRSAGEAYDFMLTKEPSNFAALRGRILVSAVMKSTEELRLPDRIVKIPYVQASASVDRAVQASLPEHKEYFSKMRELLDTGRKYKDETNEVGRIRKKHKQSVNSTYALESKKMQFYVETQNKTTQETEYIRPQTVLTFIIVMYILWVALWVAVCAPLRKNPYSESGNQKESAAVSVSTTDTLSSKEQEERAKGASRRLALDEAARQKNEKQWNQNQESKTEMMWIMITIPGVILLFVVPNMLVRMSGIKEVDDTLKELQSKNKEMKGELEEHVRACAALRSEINAKFRELQALDPMPMVPDVRKQRPGSFLKGRWK